MATILNFSVSLLIHLCIIFKYTPNTNIDYKCKLNGFQECKKNLKRDWLTSERKLKIIFSSIVHIVQSNSYQNHRWTKCVIEISVLHQLSLFSFALLAFLLQGSMKCSRQRRWAREVRHTQGPNHKWDWARVPATSSRLKAGQACMIAQQSFAFSYMHWV